MSLQLTAATDQADLLFLPWEIPLEEWPEDTLVALPRGISRHVVRFVRIARSSLPVRLSLQGRAGRRAPCQLLRQPAPAILVRVAEKMSLWPPFRELPK